MTDSELDALAQQIAERIDSERLALKVAGHMAESRLLHQLSAKFADKLLGGRRMREIVREITLRVAFEMTAIERDSQADSFLGACEARGVHFRVADDGKAYVRGLPKLTPDLLAVWNSYRKPIVERLTYLRDREQQAHAEYERRKGIFHPNELPPEDPPAVAGKVG